VAVPDRTQPLAAAPAPKNRAAPGRDRGASAIPPFEHVVERHGPALLRFCAAQAGAARAEDVFQEAMLGALRAYGQVRDPAAVRGWLFSIAARKAVDAHRDQARRPEPVADLDPSAAITSDVAFAEDGVWAHVRRLPDKQRLAVTLRYLGDLSHREIAEVMQISEAAGRRNVFEGLAGLRARIRPRPNGEAP
jgi:RNA polymerase sigma factor (sigma-70 family)